MKSMKYMNIKLNMTSLLIILLVLIILAIMYNYMINSNTIEGLDNKKGEEKHKSGSGGESDEDVKKLNDDWCKNYPNDSTCRIDQSNNQPDNKKPDNLINNILNFAGKTDQRGISDNLKIHSDSLGQVDTDKASLSNSNNFYERRANNEYNRKANQRDASQNKEETREEKERRREDKEKTREKNEKNHDKGHRTWNDDTRSYNNYNKTKDDPTSISITHSGQQILATPQNTIEGIPASQIPAGQENLYIRKANVAAPICPTCPNVIIDKALLTKECPDCPPCARCPDPAFECKKVPNYALGQANLYLPRPVLNNFSTFGL